MYCVYCFALLQPLIAYSCGWQCLWGVFHAWPHALLVISCFFHTAFGYVCSCVFSHVVVMRLQLLVQQANSLLVSCVHRLIDTA